MTSVEITNLTVEPQQDSTVKITGEIPFAMLERHRRAATKHLGKHMKAAGFRPGHVPEKVVAERAGEMAILTEMAERALADVYPKIIMEHALDAIGHPSISITKLAPQNPLGFTATVAVMPELTLPDYKTIARNINILRESDDVSDEEVEAHVKDILRQKDAYERAKAKDAVENEETHVHADGTSHAGPAHDNAKDIPVPELTDTLAQTIGQPGQFKDAADFRAKIREHLEVQKKEASISKHRAKITDEIIQNTDAVLPHVMTDAELSQMFAQMEEDMERANITIDDYLAGVKKTKEDIRNEWKPLAEKRAKLQLILNKIAEQENIEPNAGEVDHQVSHLLAQYKDADERRVRTYVESVLRNEKVMQMLEKISGS